MDTSVLLSGAVCLVVLGWVVSNELQSSYVAVGLGLMWIGLSLIGGK